MCPAYQVETFERLVDEIERVSSVGECPFGLGSEQSVGQHIRRDTGRNRREQGTFGRLAVAHICPATQPALERGRRGPASKRRALPPRRLPLAVRCHTARAVEQGEISFLLRQHRQ